MFENFEWPMSMLLVQSDVVEEGQSSARGTVFAELDATPPEGDVATAIGNHLDRLHFDDARRWTGMLESCISPAPIRLSGLVLVSRPSDRESRATFLLPDDSAS